MNDLWNWKSNTPDYYTFIVIGTINSTYGALTPQQRFEHTLDSFRSIRNKVLNAKILYVDNSIQPLSEDMLKELLSLVDVFEPLPHNVFSYVANIHKWKSPSEGNMLHYALQMILKHNLLGKRIFKLGGRYKLSDTFDIAEYEQPKYQGKFAFLPKQYNLTADNFNTMRNVWFLEQALISFDPILIEKLMTLLPGMVHYMITTEACIEETMAQFIPMDKTIALEKAHVEGIKADDFAEKKE